MQIVILGAGGMGAAAARTAAALELVHDLVIADVNPTSADGLAAA